MFSVYDILDGWRDAERLEEGHAALAEALRHHGLNQIAYAAVNLPNGRSSLPRTAVTYSPEWMRRYEQEEYANIDPAVKAGLTGILPVDWSELDAKDPMIKQFFGEAQEFEISQTGLSIPIRGRFHEFALLSFSADIPAREWQSYKQSVIRDLMLVAYHFHDWVVQTEGGEGAKLEVRLSQRELDCLRWRAGGKSDWEIGVILSISERTVRFHLENARAKLDASNSVQAVAKAVNRGLLPML